MFVTAADRALIWDRWMLGPAAWMRQFRGDQDFLNAHGPKWQLWQELFPGHVASYKMNLLTGTDNRGGELRPEEIRVLCYHGQPRPWQVEPKVMTSPLDKAVP